ncbi:MAG: carbohydrate binding domain-containing protein, partial [Bacteroidetes bacterium]|nr:carbohydrate binding domain-containing protein [Bacteroidota bacterium]
EQQKLHLFSHHSFLVSKDSSFLYYDDFESRKSEQIFRGKGAFQSFKKGQNIYAQFVPHTFKSGTTYQVSVWMYNDKGYALNDWLRFIVEERNNEHQLIKSTTWFPEQSETINGNWSLVEGTFTLSDPKNSIYITSIGKDNAKEPLFADDLLIKESGMDVYKLISEEELFYNDHRVLMKH